MADVSYQRAIVTGLSLSMKVYPQVHIGVRLNDFDLI